MLLTRGEDPEAAKRLKIRRFCLLKWLCQHLELELGPLPAHQLHHPAEETASPQPIWVFSVAVVPSLSTFPTIPRPPQGAGRGPPPLEVVGMLQPGRCLH